MDDKKKCQPIFIVGMNGSGTTLLLDCLNNHPEIYGFVQETKVIPYYIKYIDKYGNLEKDQNFLKLLNDFRKLSYFKYINNGKIPPLPENWKRLPRNLSSVIDSTFLYFSRLEKKDRWCEKTPMYAQHIESLGELFPNAKFIHMIRDGRACAASFFRRWKYNPMVTIYRWKKTIRKARKQGKIVQPRYMEVRYERLTEHPEMTMKEICKFLNIPFNAKVLHVSRKRNHTGSNEKEIKKNKKIWLDIFNRSKIKKLESIAGKLLDELGYETIYYKKDNDLNPIVLKIYLYRDFLRRAIYEIRRRKEVKWDSVYGIFQRAIRQRIIAKY